jgi:hypothetical protein
MAEPQVVERSLESLMFFENELTGSVSFLRILLVSFMSLALVIITLAIKLVLYRRRLAEKGVLPDWELRQPLVRRGTLEEFAIALAKGIEEFQRPRPCLDRW